MPPTVLHLHLPEPMRTDAAAGQVNIVNQISAAVGRLGWMLVLHGDGPLDCSEASALGGFQLLHMQEPDGPRSLCLRRAYMYPFWRIEATNDRWNWDVARASFDADTIDPHSAAKFQRRWRNLVFGKTKPSREGFLFLPLQGRLTEHRSFQSMSPIGMISETLARCPDRDIVATLHPNETYGPDELAALDRIAERHPRFRLVSAPAEDLLLRCDGVVTQNSSVALKGLFLDKPAVLFARIDFHHVAGSVHRDGFDSAFARLDDHSDHAAYLFWFFRVHAINGGGEDAPARILGRFRNRGWPI